MGSAPLTSPPGGPMPTRVWELLLPSFGGGSISPSAFRMAPVRARVGSMATSSYLLPRLFNPDPSSGPDLSESPRRCPGGCGHRLREQSCSDQGVSAVPPSPAARRAPHLLGSCCGRVTGGPGDRLSRCSCGIHASCKLPLNEDNNPGSLQSFNRFPAIKLQCF